MLKFDILIVSLISNYVDSTKATITTIVRKDKAILRSLASQSSIRVASNIPCLSCVNRKRNNEMTTWDLVCCAMPLPHRENREQHVTLLVCKPSSTVTATTAAHPNHSQTLALFSLPWEDFSPAGPDSDEQIVGGQSCPSPWAKAGENVGPSWFNTRLNLRCLGHYHGKCLR